MTAPHKPIAPPAVEQRKAPDERLLVVLRAALIMALGAVEDALGLPRSLPTRRERLAARATLRDS